MQRIHRLYYCIRLRCMVMPTRFAFLVAVASMSGTARQPVPAEFKKVEAEETGWEYFSWLYSEAEKLREPFFEQITNTVAALNTATWPKDLGLSSKEFPFKLWRGSDKASEVAHDTATQSHNNAVSKAALLKHPVDDGRLRGATLGGFPCLDSVDKGLDSGVPEDLQENIAPEFLQILVRDNNNLA